MSRELDELVSIVETWIIQRSANREFYQRDVNKFVQAQNAMTRLMIRALGPENPEFYSGLAELAINAGTLTDHKAKLIVNGVDSKNV